jgi:hypothetical protein
MKNDGWNVAAKQDDKIDVVEYVEVIIVEDAAEDDAVATEDVEINEE